MEGTFALTKGRLTTKIVPILSRSFNGTLPKISKQHAVDARVVVVGRNDPILLHAGVLGHGREIGAPDVLEADHVPENVVKAPPVTVSNDRAHGMGLRGDGTILRIVEAAVALQTHPISDRQREVKKLNR